MHLPPQRWTILVLLFVSRTGLGLQFQTLGSVSDQLLEVFDFGFAEIGSLVGAFFLSGLVFALPAGFVGRYATDKTLVATGLVALAVGGALAAIATGFGMFATARMICGIGFVLTTIYFTKMVTDWFTGKELATAMAVLVMSWPFGIAIGQIGYVWLAELFNWRIPFLLASIYCALGAVGVWVIYQAPRTSDNSIQSTSWGLPRSELVLTLFASGVWALFNAAYIVYLSFATRILMDGGYGSVGAAATVSIASWVFLFSGILCGQLVDRFGRSDEILYVCLTVGACALLLLPLTNLAVVLCLIFGLIGIAPAGVIMALTVQAMSPQNRAFGMGLFFVGYFLLQAPAPGIAGWLFDISGDPYWPILFAAVLLVLAGLCNVGFRVTQKRWGVA